MSGDPFSHQHKADTVAGNRKAAQEALEKHKNEIQQRFAQAAKPKFNDIPVYKPVWRI